MSTQRLLQVLAQQIAALAAEVTPRGDVPIPQARFDAALFANRGTRLRDYRPRWRRISPSCKAPPTTAAPQPGGLSGRKLVAQIAALQRELATRRCGARTSRKKPRGRSVPQAGRASGLRTPTDRHDSGSGKPAGAPDHAGGAAKLQHELAALEGRLMRCRRRWRASSAISSAKKTVLKIYHNILMIIPGCAPGSLYSADT